MASAPSNSDNRLYKDKKRLQINTEIGSHKDVSQTNSNLRQLGNWAIPVSPSRIPPKSSSVPVDKSLAENETAN